MGTAIDVVVVPDFDGPAARAFELYTLLFLAAWIEHSGASRLWPLRLACIGEPPSTVRRLADLAGADVTVHAPLVFNASRTSNKLRGFEVSSSGDRLLLLDVDTLVLRDLSPLVSLAGDGIGVGPATVNHFPEDTWRRIYEVAGVPYPGPTGTCWCQDGQIARFRNLSEAQLSMCRQMPPYFNSGVVLAPRRLGLDALWAQHLRRIGPLFAGATPPAHWGGGGEGDEHALATAVEAVRQRGASVALIPWEYHSRPILLRSGVQVWEQVALFHYHNAVKPYARSLGDLQHLLLGGRWRGLPGLDEFYAFLLALGRRWLWPPRLMRPRHEG